MYSVLFKWYSDIGVIDLLYVFKVTYLLFQLTILYSCIPEVQQPSNSTPYCNGEYCFCAFVLFQIFRQALSSQHMVVLMHIALLWVVIQPSFVIQPGFVMQSERCVLLCFIPLKYPNHHPHRIHHQHSNSKVYLRIMVVF